MKKSVLSLLLSAPILFGGSIAASTYAQDVETVALSTEKSLYNFTKKRYTINGTARIVQTFEGTQLQFDEAFKTRGGPDLKVYLSKKSLAELENKTVIDNSLKLSVLRSKQGAQSYTIPDNINLSDYKSVLIHCEAFTVLWGGFDL